MRFKTLYLAAVMLLAALQVVHADTYSNVYTLADVTQGNEGEVVDPSLNKEWEPGIDWHTMQIGSGGLYISNNKGATYITLASNRTQFADADLWYRTGNNTDGYLIYNKEAGPNKVLAAPTTMKGTQGGDPTPSWQTRTTCRRVTLRPGSLPRATTWAPTWRHSICTRRGTRATR